MRITLAKHALSVRQRQPPVRAQSSLATGHDRRCPRCSSGPDNARPRIRHLPEIGGDRGVCARLAGSGQRAGSSPDSPSTQALRIGPSAGLRGRSHVRVVLKVLVEALFEFEGGDGGVHRVSVVMIAVSVVMIAAAAGPMALLDFGGLAQLRGREHRREPLCFAGATRAARGSPSSQRGYDSDRSARLVIISDRWRKVSPRRQPFLPSSAPARSQLLSVQS